MRAARYEPPMTSDNQRSRFRQILESASTLSVLLASGLVIWTVLRPMQPIVARPPQAPGGPNIALPVSPLSIDTAITKGSAAAKVALVEFSEFECPFCRRFAKETLPALVKEYVNPGRVLIAFRHFPLEKIHQSARAAAEIASCAHAQGQFWRVHDLFFAEPSSGVGDFRNRALRAGVDKRTLDGCLQLDSTQKAVEADIRLAGSLSLTGTPVFFIGVNGPAGVQVVKVLVGHRPLAEFRQALDDLLK